jgi:hypothetical protein
MQNIEPDQPVNPHPNLKSVCDRTGYSDHNIWIQKTPIGYKDKCKLDLLDYGQVMNILRRIPCAAAHLLEVTTDPCLVYLANNVKMYIPEKEINNELEKRLSANTLPFYTVFRGKTDGGT